jgi:dihydrofolate reductase
MGRKTYESIGRPLPNRINIIITRDRSYKADGCVVVTSIEEAIQAGITTHSPEIFVIGGAEVYSQLMPHVQNIYLTIVHHTFDGDAYFPELDKNEWKETAHEEHSADNDNPYAYGFLRLERC